jgi:murein DD-endopeptidase MepM/ murein hydrolase activator NlpD
MDMGRATDKPMARTCEPARGARTARWRAGALATGLVLLVATAFIGGAWAGWSQARRASLDDLAVLSASVSEQAESIERAQQVANEQVKSLASRVGRIQARITRLDALGKRLTEVASLRRGEFDFDAAPALGGPESGPATAGRFTVAPIEELLGGLELAVQDRQRQLGALETVIRSRRLASLLLPTGLPVESGYISSGFGSRVDPFTGSEEPHEGLDLAAAPGTPVLAAATGIVSYADHGGSYGMLVEITHGGGYVTRYAHNASILVQPGETVRQGDTIALLGSTGRSTGPHLHFEVLRDGEPVDPLQYLSR